MDVEVILKKSLIESWLWKSRETLIANLKWESDWWPITNQRNKPGMQGQASAWGSAFFLTAAGELCNDLSLIAAFHNNSGNDTIRRHLSGLWCGEHRKIQQREFVVDFAILNCDSANPIQFTGESEMFPSAGVKDSMDPQGRGDNDYSWDFLKLLLVPSPIRLFIARIAGGDGLTQSHRIEKLAQTLQSMVSNRGSQLLAPNDVLGAVIIPAGTRSRHLTKILWLENTTLLSECAENVP